MDDETAEAFVKRGFGGLCNAPPCHLAAPVLAAVHPTPAHKAAAIA